MVTANPGFRWRSTLGYNYFAPSGAGTKPLSYSDSLAPAFLLRAATNRLRSSRGVEGNASYSMPKWSLAVSDIMEGDHVGSHTTSTFASVTPGT
jgi:hypothetical protein